MTLIRSSHGRPCRVCGTSQCACTAPGSTGQVHPFDIPQEVRPMAGEPVHEYDVNVGGYDTVMNLTETEAETHPGAKKRSGPVAADHPDRRSDAGTSGEEAGGAHSKARTAPNK